MKKDGWWLITYKEYVTFINGGYNKVKEIVDKKRFPSHKLATSALRSMQKKGFEVSKTGAVYKFSDLGTELYIVVKRGNEVDCN